MMKTGWWSVKFELTLEGESVRWDDLDEATQEHIAEKIKEGYCGGEIVIEDDSAEIPKDSHICKYCGGIAKGTYEDLLCEDCRMLFGHTLYSEL